MYYLLSDLKQKFNETMVVLQKMGINEASQEDCEIMKVVCTCVSTRAAHLVSAGKYNIFYKCLLIFAMMNAWLLLQNQIFLKNTCIKLLKVYGLNKIAIQTKLFYLLCRK